MATVSYLYTALTEGSSANIADLTDGILKFSVSGSIATPATAVPSDTTADNDYMGGSAKLSNIASLPALAGSMIIGTGDSSYWIEIPAADAGSVMYLNQTSPFANIVPAWISPGTVNQVLTVIGDTVGDPRLGWTTPATASNWSTFPATSNVDMGNFDLGIAATGQMINLLNIFAQSSQPAMPAVGGTLAFGAGMGATAVGAFAGLPELDAVNYHQLVTVTQTITPYGAPGSLLVGNAVGMNPGDYSILGAGSDDQILTLVAGTPAWVTPVTPTPYFSWVSVAGTSQVMAANTGYFANNVAPTTFTFPVTPAVGDVFEIVGPSLWLLTATGPQNIIFGDNTISGGVSFGATNPGDTIRVVCSDATVPGAEIFRVLGAVGNIEII